MEDAQLLRQYGETGSEAAFAELVRRHVDLVFSAALRQVGGDSHRAEEATQMVFISLARKASAVARHPVPLAWIYQSTRFAAATVRRQEQRRRAHERAWMIQSATEDPAVEADWDSLRPVLDDVMNELGQSDREALLLRFFANQTFADIGRQLGLSENTARMRVDRALDKLHARLMRRGITSAATALTLSLSANAVSAAPVGAAAAVTGAALSGAAGGGSLVLLNLMSSIKLQIGIAATLLAAGATSVALQQQTNRQLRREIDQFSHQNPTTGLSQGLSSVNGLRAENNRLIQEAHEASDLREADADLIRLRHEAGSLSARAELSPVIAAEKGLPVGTYALAQLDQPPTPIRRPTPVYPLEMKRLGNEGQAVIEFIVGADGNVTATKAINSSDPAFGEAAVAAVQQWQFKPGQIGGTPVGTKMRVPIAFRIQDDAADWF